MPAPVKVAPDEDRLLTRQEAADRLNVPLRFVTRCVQERRIRYVRIGRMVRIPETAIQDYFDRNMINVVRQGNSELPRIAELSKRAQFENAANS